MHSAYGVVAWSRRVGEELARDAAIRERGVKLDQGSSPELLSHSAEECREAREKFGGEGNCRCPKIPACRALKREEETTMQLLVML